MFSLKIISFNDECSDDDLNFNNNEKIKNPDFTLYNFNEDNQTWENIEPDDKESRVLNSATNIGTFVGQPALTGAAAFAVPDDLYIKSSIVDVPRDIFTFSDALSLDSWQKNAFNWDGNASNMQLENVGVHNNILNIKVEPDVINNFNYSGGEAQTIKAFNGGEYSFWVKNGAEPGTIGTASLLSPYKDNWHQEQIGIDFLGNDPTKIQFNLHSIQHNADGSVVNETKNAFNKVVDLGFDSSTDFHKYTIRWDNSGDKSITYLVDGIEKYKIENSPYIPTQDLQIKMNHWIPSYEGAKEVIGEIEPNFDGSTMQYKKIEVISQDNLNAKPTVVIDPVSTISGAIGITAAFSLVGGIIGPLLGVFVGKIIGGGINFFRRLIHGKNANIKKIEFNVPHPRNVAFAGSVSSAVICAVKGGMMGSLFGPIGIVVGVCAGITAGAIAGFLGGLIGGTIVKKIWE